jgi:hypothetical protein
LVNHASRVPASRNNTVDATSPVNDNNIYAAVAIASILSTPSSLLSFL